jgi:cytochrome P450
VTGGCPVTRTTTPAGDPAWLVTGYATVRAALADPRLGRSHRRPEQASRLSAASPIGAPAGDPDTERADHVRMRRALAGAFSARRIARLRPRVQERVDGLLDGLLAMAPPVDLHEVFSFPLPALVITELLGVPAADAPLFRAWSEDMAHMTDRPRAEAATAALRDYLAGLVADKRRRPGEDTITDLVAAADRGAISEAEVVGYSMALLFAGHVTTATAIDKGVLLLHDSPDQRDALARDPALVPGAVEEILRAPFPIAAAAAWRIGGTPRYASADLDLAGTTIREGDLVLLGRQAADQDELVFPDPQRFDIGRADNPHLAFGHGPHYCLGAPLARLELQVVFGTLPRRVPTLRLAVPAEDLRRRTDVLHATLAALPVTW